MAKILLELSVVQLSFTVPISLANECKCLHVSVNTSYQLINKLYRPTQAGDSRKSAEVAVLSWQARERDL